MQMNTPASSFSTLGPYGKAKLQHIKNLKQSTENRLKLAKLQGNEQLINLLYEELKQLELVDQ
jgi:hypothetical protein